MHRKNGDNICLALLVCHHPESSQFIMYYDVLFLQAAAVRAAWTACTSRLQSMHAATQSLCTTQTSGKWHERKLQSTFWEICSESFSGSCHRMFMTSRHAIQRNRRNTCLARGTRCPLISHRHYSCKLFYGTYVVLLPTAERWYYLFSMLNGLWGKGEK